MKNQIKLKFFFALTLIFIISICPFTFAKGWFQKDNNWYYQNKDGDLVTNEIKMSFNSKFYLGEDGMIKKNYFLENYGTNDDKYYFKENGEMAINTWVAINESCVLNKGNYVPDAYWYYFQNSGKAIKAKSGSIKKVTIDGKKYAFNEYGQLLTGWFSEEGIICNNDDNPFSEAMYYAGGDNDGVLKSGWIAYYDVVKEIDAFLDRSIIYFYFNPSNNKMFGKGEEKKYNGQNTNINYVTKKISGKIYAFDVETGIMLVEWEGYKSVTNPWYFSDENDGHRIQQGWLNITGTDKYAYFNNNGDMVKDQIKKVNGKYYAFDKKGILRKGLVAFANGKYIVNFDCEYSRGAELAKGDSFRDGKNNLYTFYATDENRIMAKMRDQQGIDHNINNNFEVHIHYFGDDCAKKTGSNIIHMADDDWTFSSNNVGHLDGQKKRKYYSNGILLKANADIKYGLIVASNSYVREAHTYEKGDDVDYNIQYYVLNTSAQLVKGTNSSKKDKEGNYWLINKDTNFLVGVYSVDVKYMTRNGFSGYFFKGDTPSNMDGDGNIILGKEESKSNQWIRFGIKDRFGRTCLAQRMAGDYQVDLSTNNDYALNFYWAGTGFLDGLYG